MMTLFPACNNQHGQPPGQRQLPPTTTTNEVIWENLKWSLVPCSHAIHHLLVTSHHRWKDLSIPGISGIISLCMLRYWILNTAVYLELDMHDQVLMRHCAIMLALEAEN